MTAAVAANQSGLTLEERVWMSISGIFNSHLIMAAAVERSGTEAQKAAWLPRFASGELRGGIALTEPDAGTDLQAIRLRADKVEGGYRLNGTKMWISNAYHGHILAVLAKTDLDATPRHKGMSLFLVEKGDGFNVTKKLEKLGYKGIDSAGFTLDDYFVPDANLVGNAEGRGMQQILGGLELGRAWRSCSPPRLPCITAWRPCACMVPTAMPRNTILSAITGTPRCSPSPRARTRCSV